MHNKIAMLLSGAEDAPNTVIGRGAVSYTSDIEGSLTELRIYGNTVFEGTPGIDGDAVFTSLGAEHATISGRYNYYVRVHGRNLLGGSELASYMQANLGADASFVTDGTELTYTTAADTGKFWLAPTDLPFKEKTVYTIRFLFKGVIDGQSTGLEAVYSDGESEEIFTEAAEGCEIAFATLEHKTLIGIRQRAAGGLACTIDTASFGIFEGVHDYSFFEEYGGYVYTLYIDGQLCSMKIGDRILRDCLYWSKKRATKYLQRVNMLSGSATKLYDRTVKPYVFTYNISEAAELEDFAFYSNIFTYVDSYDMLKGREFACTFSEDGTKFYFTAQSSTTSLSYAKKFIQQYKPAFQYPVKEKFYNTQTGAAMVTAPAGYVGIEVMGNIEPHEIRAYHI